MEKLQSRDLDILQFIAKFGYCLDLHIATLCQLSLLQTTRVINRLVESGFLIKQKIIADLGYCVMLSKQSGKLLNVKVTSQPNLNTLYHDMLLIDLYFYLSNNYRDVIYNINTDKEIRRDYGIFKEDNQLRVSDLLINDVIAIELELSEKPKSRLQEIINTYIINDEIKLVCYFLSSVDLLKKIYSLTANYDKFRLYLFERKGKVEGSFLELKCYNGNEFIEYNPSELLKLPTMSKKRFGNFEFE